MLIVETPYTSLPEFDYVLNVIIDSFLGLPYSMRQTGGSEIRIRHEGRTLALSSPFFAMLSKFGPTAVRVPQPPLEVWNASQLEAPIRLTSAAVPVLYGKPHISASEDYIKIEMDLLGSIFFMLSRLEEVLVDDRDNHDRFPATASLSFRAGFLERPIVDEYVEILWTCLTVLWPGLQRRPRAFRVYTSCDVDEPYSPARNSVVTLGRHLARDVLKFGNPSLAAQEVMNFVYGVLEREDYHYDPYYTGIDWMLDGNEAAGTSPMTFYFAARQAFEQHYSLEEPVIQCLLCRISDRGHEIGLHPSYSSFRDATLVCQEAERLRQTMIRMGIKQTKLGGRQHYLRWETPTTARAYEAAGLDHDATLTFADSAGFRCGTCHEYPFFDIQERRVLRLIEKPLVIMDRTVSHYMALGNSDAAIDKMMRLKEACQRFEGTFTLLWHNSHLLTKRDRHIYTALLA